MPALLSFSGAAQYSDVVGVEIDPVAAADQFGKTFVRRHHRERVELVGSRVLDHMLRTGMQQQRITLLDRPRITVAAGDALAMQDVEEFVRRGVLVRRRGTARFEDFYDEDVVDLIGILVEQHHEIIGIRRRYAKCLGLRNVCNAECHRKLRSAPMMVWGYET